MIIKILDNDERYICVYSGGHWFGRMSPEILSEAVQICFAALKNSHGGAKLFNEQIRNWPKIDPQTQQADVPGFGVSG